MRRWVVAVVLAVAVLAAVFLFNRDDGESRAEETCRQMRAAAEVSMKNAQEVLDMAVLRAASDDDDDDFMGGLRAECGERFVAAVNGA